MARKSFFYLEKVNTLRGSGTHLANTLPACLHTVHTLYRDVKKSTLLPWSFANFFVMPASSLITSNGETEKGKVKNCSEG